MTTESKRLSPERGEALKRELPSVDFVWSLKPEDKTEAVIWEGEVSLNQTLVQVRLETTATRDGLGPRNVHIDIQNGDYSERWFLREFRDGMDLWLSEIRVPTILAPESPFSTASVVRCSLQFSERKSESKKIRDTDIDLRSSRMDIWQNRHTSQPEVSIRNLIDSLADFTESIRKSVSQKQAS